MKVKPRPVADVAAEPIAAVPVDPPAPRRLMSLDALRGFDMFWIIGGEGLVAVLAAHTGWQIFHAMEEQLQHPDWNGFRAYDLIFPLFMFIAGVAMPFSLSKRLERGDGKLRLHAHVIRRGLLLVLLGMIYNGMLLFDFENLRYPSVLGRIGLGYMFAGLIFLNTSVRAQVVCVAALLLGYWAALMYIPCPNSVPAT
jgi:predicted acyltransferase